MQLQLAAAYAVPTQILFKQWRQAAQEQSQSHASSSLAANTPTAVDLSRRLLLRNPSEDAQLLMVAPPATGRFRLVADTTEHTQTDGNSAESAFHVPGGEPYKCVCYALPPRATLTLTVIFGASSIPSVSSSAASRAGVDVDSANYQDAIFVFTAECTSGPAITVPLLAIGSADSAHADSFTPVTLTTPPNPPAHFFAEWQQQSERARDDDLTRAELQQAHAGAPDGHADVFVVEDDEAPRDDLDDPMSAAEDDDASMRELGQRISAAAARADAEEADRMDDAPAQSSSTARATLMSSAGLFRSGLTARLHSSHGARSGGATARHAPHANHQPLPGEVHIYQPFQRPVTAEQRHLADHLDSGFVVSTEAAIDELVHEDFDAAEAEEERLLLQSAHGVRPSTSHRATPPSVPTLQIAPAAMVFQQTDQVSPEQDEAAFYQQILATARTAGNRPDSALASATSARKSSFTGAAPSTPTSAADPSAPRVARQGSARRAHAGIPRSSPSHTPGGSMDSPSFAYPAAPPRYSPEPRARISSHSDAPYQSPPASTRPSSRGVSTPTTSSMIGQLRQLHLGAATADDEWSERLAREQDIERRRYVEQNTPTSAHRYASDPAARAISTPGGSVKFPKLK